MKLKDKLFLKKILVAGFLILLSILWIIKSKSLASYFIPIIILGMMYAHLIELQHQCIHNTAFSSKKLNKILGFLIGIPFFISFSQYKKSHHMHHRNLGTQNDKEFIDYNLGKSNLLWSLFCLSRFSLKNSILINIFDLEKSVQVRVESFLITTLAAVFITISPHYFILMWLLPLVLVAHPVHFLIEIPEHYKCSVTSSRVEENTRTIKKPSRFSVWITNYNHLHVEHHMYQHIIPERLALIGKGVNHHYISENYISFYKELYTDLGV